MRSVGLALAFCCAATAWAVQVGDTRAAVIAELGEPKSKMTAGTREILTYPEGRIEISQGLVSEVRGSFASRSSPPAAATPAASEPAAPAAPNPAKPKTKPSVSASRTAHWFTSLSEAQAAAAKNNKRILALFTGSDWCGPCQQFDAEVAHDEQFAGIFARDFVFFKNDWLRNTPQPEAVKSEVNRVRLKYLIQVYPTLLVLNAEGEKLAKVGWKGIEGGSLKEVAIEAIDHARKATKDGKKASGSWWPF
jgi:thiol-disulfide isomerase/thioredoxin